MRKRRKIEDLTLKLEEPGFSPATIEEAKRALELGLIDISEYVEVSLSMEPIVDALSDPDLAVRRKAIFDLAEHRNHRWAVEKLRQLLEDEDQETRLYAVEALEKLDNRFLSACYGLEKALRERPQMKQAIMLALLYLEYAQTRLPGKAVGEWYLKRADQLLTRLINGGRPSAECFHARGRVRMAMGDVRAALTDLKHAVQLNPVNKQLYLDLAEAYYRLGDFTSVSHSCKYVSQSSLESPYEAVVEYWLSS